MPFLVQLSLLFDYIQGIWTPNTKRYNDFLQCLAESRVLCFMVVYALEVMVLDPSARQALEKIVLTVMGPDIQFSQISGKSSETHMSAY